MDVFVEQLIKKETDSITFLKRAGIILATLIISLAVLLFSGFLGPLQSFAFLLAVGAVYGGWFLLNQTRLEYEYINTNGEIDIDKIVAQRKRLRLCSIKSKEIESIGKYNPNQHKNKGYQRVVKSCINENDAKNTWYITYRDSKHGNTLVLITPNEKFLTNLKKYLPRQIQADVQVWN